MINNLQENQDFNSVQSESKKGKGRLCQTATDIDIAKVRENVRRYVMDKRAIGKEVHEILDRYVKGLEK